MIWPFKQQADEAQEVLDRLLELQSHINDTVAMLDLAEAATRLRHATLVLKGHDHRDL